MIRRVIAVENAEKLSKIAGHILIDITKKSIAERGRAVVLVSGGTSIAPSYEAYGKAVGIDWTKVFFFWGDDRFVEPTNPYSNYGLVKNSLLSNAVGLPPENVFPIAFDASTPAQCAELYAKKIQEFFELRDGEWPVFDLAQNGIGPDGHTASLFPNTPAALEDDKIAVANHAGLKPWVDRISLTLPVFNHARNVVFVTSGAAKATTVKTVLEGSPSRSEMPAAHVKPIGGTLFWLLDRDASANLSMPLEKAY